MNLQTGTERYRLPPGPPPNPSAAACLSGLDAWPGLHIVSEHLLILIGSGNPT